MTALNPRFNDLPLLRLPSYECPTHDGDMAWLHELADRILCHPRHHIADLTPSGSIYYQTCDVLRIYPHLWGGVGG